MLKRRKFLSILGGTALVPLMPVVTYESAQVLPSLVLDFEADYYEKDGEPCRMEDVVTMRRRCQYR